MQILTIYMDPLLQEQETYLKMPYKKNKLLKYIRKKVVNKKTATKKVVKKAAAKRVVKKTAAKKVAKKSLAKKCVTKARKVITVYRKAIAAKRALVTRVKSMIKLTKTPKTVAIIKKMRVTATKLGKTALYGYIRDAPLGHPMDGSL